jgi:porphobilinogen synthase
MGHRLEVSGQFPSTRMRRIRMKDFSRTLCRETSLSPGNLILPVFVVEGKKRLESIPSMPGINRMSIDLLARHVKEAEKLGIGAVAVFPVIEQNKKSLDARSAWDMRGLVPSAIKTIKDTAPALGVISDVALDPYTTHGQDGLIDKSGKVLNDETVIALVKQALCHAKSGSDIVAPSDMMDGRIGKIRAALEESGFKETMILAYSAKFASAYYGPFRDAVGSKNALGHSDKRTYQMDIGNSDEAMREIALDISEGADMVMVKPGLPYLDIIRRAREEFNVPILAYNVSGEYSMVKAAAAHKWLDEQAIVLESLTCLRRAGARGILTYHALDAAKWMS